MLFLPVNVQEDSRILPEQEISCQVLACFNPYSVKANSVGTAWTISTGRFLMASHLLLDYFHTAHPDTGCLLEDLLMRFAL